MSNPTDHAHSPGVRCFEGCPAYGKRARRWPTVGEFLAEAEQPAPLALCRRCPRPYRDHVTTDPVNRRSLDHKFEQLTDEHEAPAWMTAEQREQFASNKAASLWTTTSDPLRDLEAARVAATLEGQEALSRAAASSWSAPGLVSESMRDMTARMADAIDAQVLGHLEAASQADLDRIVHEAGTDDDSWIDRAYALAAQLRATRVQRDGAEAQVAWRGEQLDRLEAMIRRFAVDTGAVEAEAEDYDDGTPADVEPEDVSPHARAMARHDEAYALLRAVDTIKQTGGAVEIAGVKIEPCDERGRTASDVEPIDLAGIESLEEAVYTAIGAGTTAWEHLEGAGVFDEQRARSAAEGLLGWLRNGGMAAELADREACPAYVENVDTEGKGIGYRCDLEAGHAEPHTSGHWTWR